MVGSAGWAELKVLVTSILDTMRAIIETRVHRILIDRLTKDIQSVNLTMRVST